MADEVKPVEPVVADTPAVGVADNAPGAPGGAAATPAVETVVVPAVETPAAEAPKTVADTPSLIEEAKAPGSEEPPKVEEVKPAEPAKVEEAPKVDAEGKPIVEAKPEDKPVEPEKPVLQPVEYKYELPEHLALTDETKTFLNGVLDAFRQDPTNTQPLIDFHVKALEAFADMTRQQQHVAFNDTRMGWQKEITGDEELGGSGFETTKAKVARMRDLLVTSANPAKEPERYAKEMKEFQQFVRITGAGDHRAFWRILNNAGTRLDEPALPSVEIKPAPNGRMPGERRMSRLYDKPLNRDS